ncbi:hypothetical protein [Bordetella sp. FB-8]|uniref:hypothetical protein n=1 Tax=Bordetella sp. FB-8 TaxID=1159870 RepID=UPI00037E29CC|nr:hypothetical protein [Bordetella sp. FB-8]
MRITHWPIALLLAAHFLPAAHAAPAAAAQHYVGLAYARDGGKLVYSEEHWVVRNRGAQQHIVLYRCPNGKPFARERLDGGIEDAAPDFEFEDSRSGYIEGVTGRGDERQVYVRSSLGAPRRTAQLPTPRNAVIDAGFDAYLRSHWKALGAGQDTEVAFLVPSRLKYLHLAIRTSDATYQGQPARRFKLSLNAWYGFVLPSIEVTYSIKERRLLRFEGIGNIHSDQGDTQQVRIEFPANRRYGPPSALQIDHAETEPLVSRCGIEK